MLDKSFSILGICQRAGKLVSGEVAVENAIRNREVCLILVSEDASENTKKKFKNSSEFYKIEFMIKWSKVDLGKAIGKEVRSVIGITDEGLKEAFKKNLAERQ